MECSVCGAFLRWAHLEASAEGSKCSFCGTTVVPVRPDGCRDVDELFIRVDELPFTNEEVEDPLALLEPFPERKKVPAWSLVAISLIAVIGLSVWRLATSTQPVGAPVRETVPSVADEPRTTSPDKAHATPTISAVLHIDDRSWVAAIADGERVAYETYEAPRRLAFNADDTLLLTLGNPQGVRLAVDGKPIEIDQSNTVHLRIAVRKGHVVIARVASG